MANLQQPEECENPVHNHMPHIMENGNNGNGFQQELQVVNGNQPNGHIHFPAHHQQAHENGNGAIWPNGEGQENGEGALEAVLPAWALARPVDGYIKHPVAGFIMHPSFYDNRHLINLETKPRYNYDGEVDGPLCPPGQKCIHIKNCFEIRVRMAVLAYRMHSISFRDAEYIWRVSRSTIQRRKAALDKCDPIIFLITPEHSVV